ncbi:hypothetical protein ETU09_05995 [Apibacter muscae]|uniref:Gp5/Type VI secretion system Vgr protein OB-fold domain-containing protein n=1 Tax=Apibacter muscae TaxID=2509004 RepID=A0A563DEA6_9FLAO|nr:contractile injection system protein, VgrG/Pvc8 family [Apibacter muscae]TWP28472.1 hypothetical protein ETU09_05995 [Apibacter muscae]
MGEDYNHISGKIIEDSGLYHRSSFGDSFLPFAKVTINGKELSKKHHIQVNVYQEVLTHNKYELLIPSEAFSDHDTYPLQNSKYLLGQQFSIQLIQFKKTTLVFEGMITHVEYLSENKYPYIKLIGLANSLLLDGNKRTRSFENKSLKDIVKKVTSDYNDNRLNFLIEPETEEIIPYTVQYSETDFEFLKRLAIRYGEYFYHNGEYLIFGNGDLKRTELSEGRDFQKYSLDMQSLPQHFITQQYDLNQDELYTINSKSLHYPDIVNLFQFQAVNASEKAYAKNFTDMHIPALLNEGDHAMYRAVERKRKSNQSTLWLNTETNHPALRLGDAMKMNAWDKTKQKHTPIETYKILKIQHQYSCDGYLNRAQGVPIQQKVAPYLDERAFPKADNQVAKVVDNNAPLSLNRVRVQFKWQEASNEKNPWIPLVQGHSGSGTGAHVVPEIDHTVYVEFISGNAEVPLVIGSLYNGSQKSGYHTAKNDLKVFQTRSGTQRIANDAEGSILEKDAAGSYLKLEGDGNATLHIEKNLTINVGENCIFTVGKNIQTRIGNEYTCRVLGNAKWVVTGSADYDIKGDYTTHTDKGEHSTSEGEINYSSKNVIQNNSQKQVKNNSGETSNLF